jgi:hypothetical protein
MLRYEISKQHDSDARTEQSRAEQSRTYNVPFAFFHEYFGSTAGVLISGVDCDFFRVQIMATVR